MKGIYPTDYLHNPNPFPDKSIEQIWDDLDTYSFEELYQLPHFHESIRFMVPIPPLTYQGKFIKGFCFTQGAEVLLNRLPHLQKLFIVCANSMCFSYPWAHQADCFFTCYHNPEREAYMKKKYPEIKNVICLPTQDADYTNEKIMTPWLGGMPKTIDVFCVSTAFPVKNLPLFAHALKIYEQKYHHRLKVVCSIGNKDAIKQPDGTLDYSKVNEYDQSELRKIDEILGDTKSYIDLRPYIDYYDLPKYYTIARCGVLASLIEGKNRFLSEGMCCDMPVITFRDFNRFCRGSSPAFPENCGEYAPEFTAESLADTIHYVITHPTKYSPRENYLKHYGRINFIKNIVNHIPYYRDNIPQLNDGNLTTNQWINDACQHNYQMNYESFLYDKNHTLSNIAGLTNILNILKQYHKQHRIFWMDTQEKQKKSLLNRIHHRIKKYFIP